MIFDEKEVVVNDECVDAFVPLRELFIKNFYIVPAHPKLKNIYILSMTNPRPGFVK